MTTDDAVAVTRDIHWVGFHDEGSGLQCNPYLLVDHDEAVLFDPGSIPHFPIVMRKVLDIVSPQQIGWLVVHHQDPDVCGNLPVMEDVIGRADLQIVTARKSARLIRHYGLSSHVHVIEDHDMVLRLASGRTLRFIPTPFLHAPGAFATYDERTGTLFSSDLFGGIGEERALFAEGEFLEAMGAFHREYMPSGEVLRSCMGRLAELELQRICPQHGSVLEGGQIEQALAYLGELRCGVDLADGADAER